MKGKLGSAVGFAQIAQSNKVIGLLDLRKTMSHSTAGVQEPYGALQDVLGPLTAMNLGNYCTKKCGQLLQQVQTSYRSHRCEVGSVLSAKLAASDSDDDKKLPARNFFP